MSTAELTVAKSDRKPSKKKPGEPDYSTFRIIADDGEDLSNLSELSGIKDISRTYRQFLAPVVKKLLAEMMERKLSQLKRPDRPPE